MASELGGAKAPIKTTNTNSEHVWLFARRVLNFCRWLMIRTIFFLWFSLLLLACVQGYGKDGYDRWGFDR